MSYEGGNGTGRHARLPPRGAVMDTHVPPSPPPPARKSDPIAAVSRWWSLAVVVASLTAAGWYAAQVLNGYAERTQVDEVQRDVRAIDQRARDLERTAQQLLDAQRDAVRRHEQIAERLDWLVRQEVEDARRVRRTLTSMPPRPIGVVQPAAAAAVQTEGP